MDNVLSKEQLRVELRRKCAEAGSQMKWAAENNVSPQCVSDFLRGRKGRGVYIARALGYTLDTIYVPMNKEEPNVQ